MFRPGRRASVAMETVPSSVHLTSETVHQFVLDEAEDARITPRVAWAALLLPWVGAVLVAATNAYRPLYRALTAEDRLFEWIQVLFIAIAVVLAARAALLLWKRGEPLTALLWAVFAIGCVGIFGEEVAWGQRILHFATPATIKDVNTQASTTVHNLQGAGVNAIDLFNAAFLVVGLFGSVGAAIIRWRTRADRTRLVDLVVPPLHLASLFFLVVAYKVARFTLFRAPRRSYVTYGEYIELGLAIALAGFAWAVVRLLTRERSPIGVS
jgi:hypothetical protein